MASLSPGVLVKLLQELDFPDDDKNCNSDHHRRAAVLQVTSIIPAIAGTDLFSHHGFYLKVSDSSHATYVSLPQDQVELILSDKLQLGQFIQVQRLENASPVPALRGVRLLPGRHPCLGNPSDIIATMTAAPGSDLAQFLDPSSNPVPALPDKRKKSRSLSASRLGENGRRRYKSDQRFRSIPSSPVNGAIRRYELEKKNSEISKELAKISVTCIDVDSEGSDSSRSSLFSCRGPRCRIPRPRRNWDAGSRILEHTCDLKPLSRTCSDSVTPSEFARPKILIHRDYDSDYFPIRKRDTQRPSDFLDNSSKQKFSCSTKPCTGSTAALVHLVPANDLKQAVNYVLPSLPSNLARVGKEVLKHRDLALITAVEALQEASASERLVRCMSLYSEIQHNKEADVEQLVDRFLNLHDDITEARYIVQSLAKISPLRRSNSQPISSASIKEAVKITLDRKRRAAMWVQAAMESDLAIPIKPAISSSEASNLDEKLLSTITCCLHPKGGGLTSKQRTEGDIWLKGRGPLVAADLANGLQLESNRWFLNYIETFLDGVQGDTIYSASEHQIASLLCQMKKVDEWLDAVACKERTLPWDGCKWSSPDQKEGEACDRVRKKIYGILLKHVECAANALENMHATDEDSLENMNAADVESSDTMNAADVESLDNMNAADEESLSNMNAADEESLDNMNPEESLDNMNPADVESLEDMSAADEESRSEEG